MKIKAELTDTFGGEANYSWVRRIEFEVPDNSTQVAIVRRAKLELGYNGIRCRGEEYGDYLALYPYKECRVIFIFLSGD